jgi:hypothetical protein
MRQFLLAVGLTGLATLTALAAGEEGKKADKEAGKKVEVKGTLRTGVVAVGGETTGVVVATKAGTYELELGKDKDLRRQAEKFNGKAVVVAGTLEVRKGVEVKERRIITVTSLTAADEK